MKANLLLVAGGGLWSLGCSGALVVLLARSRRAARTVAGRIETVLRPHRAADPSNGPGTRQLRLRPAGLLYRLIGYNPSRAWRYRLSIRRVLLLCAFPGVLAALLASRILGPVADLAAAPVFLFSARSYFRRADRRHAAKLLVQFPDALSMIVRAVRVGVPVGGAIAIVSREAATPTREEFRDVAESVAIGRPLNDALARMAERSTLTEYRFFATALALQARAGGSLTETLETLADTIRKRVATRQRGHALASEARASTYIIAALPFAVGAGLLAISPSYMTLMFTTPIGNKLLALAACSLGTGLFAMNWISKRVLR